MRKINFYLIKKKNYSGYPHYYHKIFSFDYLENFNNFLIDILKLTQSRILIENYMEGNTINISYSNFRTTCQSEIHDIIKLEKKIFKFIYNDKKLLKYKLSKELLNSRISIFINKKYLNCLNSLKKKKLVINCSKFIEFCFKKKLYNHTFSEFNKILIFYLLNFYDISNRKLYPYINPFILIYFVSNPNIEDSFKRFIVSRFLVNMDLLKYNQLIDLINYTTENCNLDLYYPFNPLNIDKKLLSKYFNDKNAFTLSNIFKTLTITDRQPISQKIYLLENVINRWDRNFFEQIYTHELLNMIKALQIFEIESGLSHFTGINPSSINLSESTKQILSNLKNEILIKLKYRMKTLNPEFYLSNIPLFLNTIDEFINCSKYINHYEIIDLLFLTIIKTAERNEIIRNHLTEIFEKFLEFFPKYIIKMFFNEWVEHINFIRNNKQLGVEGKTTFNHEETSFQNFRAPRLKISRFLNIFKSVIYLEIDIKKTQNKMYEDISILHYSIKEVFYSYNHNQLFNSLDELIEFYFYLCYYNNCIEKLDKFDDKLITLIDYIYNEFLTGESLWNIENLILYPEQHKVKIDLSAIITTSNKQSKIINFLYILLIYSQNIYSLYKNQFNYNKFINELENVHQKVQLPHKFEKVKNEIETILIKSKSKSEFKNEEDKENFFDKNRKNYDNYKFLYLESLPQSLFCNIDNKCIVEIKLYCDKNSKSELTEIILNNFIRNLYSKSFFTTFDYHAWIKLSKKQKTNYLINYKSV